MWRLDVGPLGLLGLLMLCAEITPDGYVHIPTAQPVDVSACTLVVASASELGSSPFAMTPEQGAQVGTAVFGLWAVAWCFRAIAHAINQSSGDLENE